MNLMEALLSFILANIDTLESMQLVGTLGMLGIVCFVQAVQYPMLARVPLEVRSSFDQEYCGRASIVIAPLMISEAISTFALVLAGPHAWTPLAVLGLALVTILWLITFLISVPAHRALITGWDQATHRRLLRSNWARVLGWIARSVIVLKSLTPH